MRELKTVLPNADFVIEGCVDPTEPLRDENPFGDPLGSRAGTIDLLLTYVESGTEFTRQFGDINEAYYHSLASALNELVALRGGETVQPLAAAVNPILKRRLSSLTYHEPEAILRRLMPTIVGILQKPETVAHLSAKQKRDFLEEHQD